MKFTSPVVIGLECHVELNTETKLFCPCKRAATNPNTFTCPICLGHPGSKPVFNETVLEFALKLCLALKCKIAPQLLFSRKSYFYPDMAKNYQITQHELPLGTEGQLILESGKTIPIQRVHIEEDPASLIHKPGFCLVDYNRSGNPLVEIVTEPELTSPEEARDFLKQLITILKYLEIFNPNTNTIKADANISIKESNYTRVEIKNISGFKEIEKALFYEVDRQKQEPKSIIQETRGWDAKKSITVSQRKKEQEQDYGYIIDPDLVPIDISKKQIDRIEGQLPELAEFKKDKFSKLGVKDENAKIISKDKDLALLFEKVASKVDPDLASKWIRREVLRIINYHNKKASEVLPEGLIKILQAVEKSQITDKVAKELLEKYIVKPFDVEKDLKSSSIMDTQELKKICKEIIQKNSKAVDSYQSGEEKSFNFLVGQVMKETKGKADPSQIKKSLKENL